MVIKQDAVEKMDVGGSQLQFLATPEQIGKAGYSVMRGTLPAHGVVPLHSHPDPEMFYVLDDQMDCYQDAGEGSGWQAIGLGEMAVIPGSVKHALRNAADAACVCFVFTGSDVCHFLEEIAQPADAVSGAGTSQDVAEKMMTLAKKYNHWLGSPEENKAIGLQVG